MTIRTTRWSPIDTCGCVVEYTWDDTLTEANRTHTLSNVINKCPAHTALTNSSVYTTILDENPKKNNALQLALDNSPTTALYDTINGTRQLKPTITYSYSFSGTAPNRVLTISFTGITLTTQQKTTIQTALNTRFGSGRVLMT
jgi:hypothetical protein